MKNYFDISNSTRSILVERKLAANSCKKEGNAGFLPNLLN
jgi:hypothetical protein